MATAVPFGSMDDDGVNGGPVFEKAGLGLDVADFVTAVYLGRDFEVGFFAVCPKAERMTGFRDNMVGPAKIETVETYLQTGRFRLSPPAAAHLAFNIVKAMRHGDEDSYLRLKQALTAEFSNDQLSNNGFDE